MIEYLMPMTLLGVILFQQYAIQKLVNKVMSRSFHEYESAKELSKPAPVKLSTAEMPEDLRSLQEFSL